jgi:hypothetical protein
MPGCDAPYKSINPYTVRSTVYWGTWLVETMSCKPVPGPDVELADLFDINLGCNVHYCSTTSMRVFWTQSGLTWAGDNPSWCEKPIWRFAIARAWWHGVFKQCVNLGAVMCLGEELKSWVRKLRSKPSQCGKPIIKYLVFVTVFNTHQMVKMV